MLSIFKPKRFLIDYLGGFVDIHNHILPGIDDGAKNIGESLQLLRELKESGITSFINTPHTMNDYYPNTPDSILEALESLKPELKTNNLNDVNLKASSEYMMDEHFEEILENKEILTLKDNYILVEMSYLQPPYNLEEILYKINLAGYKPVLAHPERYGFYHNNYEYYTRLKTLGCDFQLNILSLTTQYGTSVQKTANRLLQDGLIDYLATDTHHLRHIEMLRKLKVSKQQLVKLEGLIDITKSRFFTS